MRVRVVVFALAAQSCMACLAAHAEPPDGRAVFKEQCAVCHQPNGQGVPGQFPPLARNSDLFLARDFPVRVVLFGMGGKISVNGQAIDGTMPPIGEDLEDAQVAAVVNYVRGAFGNNALAPKALQPVDASVVRELRKKKAELSDQVHSYREMLKAQPAKN